MKNKSFYAIILIFGFLLFDHDTMYGQKDSIKRDTIRKEYHENQNGGDYYLKRSEKYDYFTRAKIEELSMFKIGLGLSYSGYGGVLGLAVGYEKKLSPDFSIDASAAFVVPNFTRKHDLTFLDISLGGRYYYNMRERMWEGKSANNLSGNYLSFQFTELIGTNEYYFPFLEGLYGIQRRLGHRFFFDVNLGGSLDYRIGLQPAFNFAIGVGL